MLTLFCMVVLFIPWPKWMNEWDIFIHSIKYINIFGLIDYNCDMIFDYCSLDWVVHPIRDIKFWFDYKNLYFSIDGVVSIIKEAYKFYCCKNFSFLYLSMVNQEKRSNLESSFWDSMVVKERRSNLGSSWFEIHDSIVMLNWT